MPRYRNLLVRASINLKWKRNRNFDLGIGSKMKQRRVPRTAERASSVEESETGIVTVDTGKDSQPWSDILPIFAFATLVKLLLIPSYRSTDFEVHRNWLAITHSLPREKWYYEDRSEWTLDYPPFFAWFEWTLSQAAQLFYPAMLDLDNLEDQSWQTVLFQRATVILSEFVFLCGAERITRHARTRQQRVLLVGLIALSPGIVFVDHIHFQYNGFLYGIQLLSIAAMMEKRHILGGILFAVVLNFKHIYLYQAPAYFVYILRSYCFDGGFFSLKRFAAIASSTLAVFAISFGPFVKHIPQILSRLFPFKRGLCHAYWAPNFWAVYAFGDRIFIQVAKVAKVPVSQTASLTRGLIGNTAFSILPDIQPIHTMILTVLSQLPILAKLWVDATPATFLDSLILCGFGSYLFGWHVHEKAILLVLVPLSLTVERSPKYARAFYILTYTGVYSLFPLLFKPAETITKMILLMAFAVFGYHALKTLHSAR
ncbi:hypothetical protein PhCBS80983_g02703 [Powellomyces hirtus]|uniref:Alpha-1,3-glucosyltransferase n=1 Tax=Powellomyces hirtus TaxID=109895 RepID=A0A507E5C4_9FUNG|nr:hypothetical protein PhCBS80983_g02703 [Powellomyces hirtus]